VDNGATIAQILVGHKTRVTDIYMMKLDSNFVMTLQDNIHERGVMDELFSNDALVEISNKVKDILCHHVIADWQSEPYHEHQNPAKHWYQMLKWYKCDPGMYWCYGFDLATLSHVCYGNPELNVC
jgi:hypothetical protein